MTEFNSFYKSIDKRKFNTWCKYTKRLDTYGCGCQHNCSYCYSKSLLSFRGLWNAVEPSIANMSKVERTIQKIGKGEIVKLGGMTDCFQPFELIHRNTFKTIKLLNRYKVHYLIVTKNILVSDDLYLSIYDKQLAHFQITITSTSENTYEHTSTPRERIKSIELLQSLGYDVSVRLSPFIEKNIEFKIINNIKCDKILIEFLKVNHWVKKWFNIDYSEYSLKYGGYSHLQLNKKIELVNKITGFKQKTVGEYVKEHYEYFRDNVNYNKYDCCNLNEFKQMKTNQLKLF